MHMRKILCGGIAMVLVALSMVFLTPNAAIAAETCPSGGEWYKTDGVKSKTFTHTAPAGYKIVEVCAKSAQNIAQMPVAPTQSFTFVSGEGWLSHFRNNNGKVQDLSHVSVRKVKDTPPPPHDECDNLPGDQPKGFDCDGPEPNSGEDYSEGDPNCVTLTVDKFKQTWTQPYVFENGEWVLGAKQYGEKVKIGSRELTEAEILKCAGPQPEPEKREKVTEDCTKAIRVTDFYETPYVLKDGKWVLGKEQWVGKDVENLTAAECGYKPQVREKVTVKCGAGGQWIDYYVREWSFVNKQWVLGPEKWSHKEFVKFNDEEYFDKCAPDQPEPKVTSETIDRFDCDGREVRTDITTTPYVWSTKDREWVLGTPVTVEGVWKFNRVLTDEERAEFWKQGKCLTPIEVPAPPAASDADCDTDGSLTIPVTEHVMTVVNGVAITEETTYGPGTYEVTYSPEVGYTFGDAANEPITVTVDAKTNDCPATILTSPKVDPVCTAEGEDVVTQGTGEHVTWKQTPTQVVDGRTKYRFVATPDEGYVLPAEGDWDKVVDGKAVWEIWVANEDCALPAPPAPQPVPPTCDSDGSLTVEGAENVVATITNSEGETFGPEDGPFGPGTYSVTYVPADGYSFPEGEESPEYPVTVEAATGDCPTDEETPPTDEETPPTDEETPPTDEETPPTDEEEQPKPDEPTKAEKPVVRKAAVVAQAAPKQGDQVLPNTGGPEATGLILAGGLLLAGAMMLRRFAR